MQSNHRSIIPDLESLPEALQRSVKENDNHKLLPEEGISLVISLLEKKPDGRYDKKSLQEALLTLSDSETEIRPIIKLKGSYYAVDKGSRNKKNLKKGAYGLVKPGQNLLSGAAVAIKTQESIKPRSGFRKVNIPPEKVKETVQLEIAALEAMDRGTGEIKGRSVQRPKRAPSHEEIQFCIVMDYVDGLPLDALLETGPIAFSTCLEIAIGTLTDVQKLHHAQGTYHYKNEDRKALGFYHCDLKPGNIIYDPAKRQAKVIDFGTVSPIDAETKQPVRCVVGTLTYYAPELRKGLATQPSEATEVYALGLIFAEVFNFITKDKGNEVRDIFKWVEPPVSPEQKAAYELIKQMAAEDPKDRPTLQTALETFQHIARKYETTNATEEQTFAINEKRIEEFLHRQEKIASNDHRILEKKIVGLFKESKKRKDEMLMNMLRCLELQLGQIDLEHLSASDKQNCIQLCNKVKILTDEADQQIILKILKEDILEKMTTFFHAECKKHSRSFLLSTQDPINVLNAGIQGQYYYTRAIGSLLKLISSDNDMNSFLKKYCNFDIKEQLKGIQLQKLNTIIPFPSLKLGNENK